MKNLSLRLRDQLFAEIERLNLCDNRLSRITWDDTAVNFLSFCIREGHITDLRLREAVRKRLSQIAVENYHRYLDNEHIPSWHVLAWAYEGDMLPSDVRSTIRDAVRENGITLPSDQYNLLSSIIEEMQNKDA